MWENKRGGAFAVPHCFLGQPMVSTQQSTDKESLSTDLREAKFAFESRGDFGPWLALAQKTSVEDMDKEFWEWTAFAALLVANPPQYSLAKKAAQRAPLKDIRVPQIEIRSPAWGEPGVGLLNAATSPRARRDEKLAPFLLAAGCDVRWADEQGRTPLMNVLGDLKKIALFAPHSDLNAKDKNGDTALMIAAKRQDEFSLDALLAAGADPKTIDNNGNTLLIVWMNNRPEWDPDCDDIDRSVKLARLCDWRAANKAGETFIDKIWHTDLWRVVDEIALENGRDGVDWAQRKILAKLMPQSRVVAAAIEEAESLRKSMGGARLSGIRKETDASTEGEQIPPRKESPRL